MKVTESIEITNECRTKLMSRSQDNDFDLGSYDPEYGIGASKPTKKPNKIKQKNGTITNVKTKEYKHKTWDNKPADSVFGKEAIRISKNQLIWGANHFDWIVDKPFKPPRRNEFNDFILKYPKGWIIWDKLNGGSDQWDCELAWTSFDFDTVIIPFMWSGMMQGSKGDGSIMEGNKKLNEKRIHPTQKPVRIYEKVYDFLYKIKPFKTVIDTGLGSGNNAIACHNLGFKLTACEKEKDYFDASIKRIQNRVDNLNLFDLIAQE